MKYIFIALVLIFSFGCEEKVDKELITNVSTVSDTSSLQPKIDDSSLQPPNPPSLH